MKKVHLNLTILFLSICFGGFAPAAGAQFQRQYGTALDEAFGKVIPSGTNYYVLSQGEVANGQPPRATVSFLNAAGVLQWTRSLNTASSWNDAVLTPSGNLLVVGNTLPLDANSQSLMGVIMPSGAFSWVRSYSVPGRESFNRVVRNPVPHNAAFPYYVLGFQQEPGAVLNWDDVVLLTVSETGNPGWKKIYSGLFGSSDDEFARDLEALPNGDLLLAGNWGTTGVVLRTDRTGAIIGGLSPEDIQMTFADVAQAGSGFIAAGSQFPAFSARLMKFDADLLPQWQLSLPNLTAIRNVWASGSSIYVSGSATVDGLNRGVVIKFQDGASAPTLQWMKYLQVNETSYSGGTAWPVPNGLAFTDGRVRPDGFGGAGALLSVSGLEMNTCMTQTATTTVTATDHFFNSPDGLGIEFTDVFPGMDLGSTVVDWQQADACGQPCEASISVNYVDSCGHVQLTAVGSGLQPFSYQWCSGESTATIDRMLLCGSHDFCVSITCADGTVASASTSVVVSDNIPPAAICALGQGYELNANCTLPITVAMIDGGSFDNCQIQSLSVSPTVVQGCGIFPVTLTVTDWCGNISTCATEIQTIEVVPPVIVCPPNITLACDNDISPATTGMATATDNCDPNPVITFSDEVMGLMPCDGFIQRTWTAMDDCGNESTCVQIITVRDTVPPIITCPQNVVVTAFQPHCVIGVYNIQPVLSDNCIFPTLSYTISGATIGLGPGNANGTVFNVGVSTVTYTAMDFCGNTATCSFTVTVVCGDEGYCDCPAGGFQGPNLVVNSDFSAGNTGFSSDYTNTTFPTPGPGYYSVGHSLHLQNVSFWSGVDHTTAAPMGLFLTVDASQTPSLAAWRQQFTLTQGTDYLFCAYADNLFVPNSNAAVPLVEVWIIDANNVATLITSASLPEIPNVWVKLSGAWTAPATVANPYKLEIRAGTTVQYGNDFAVDDISFRACSAPPPCEASISVNYVDNCGHVQLTAVGSGLQPFSYQWCSGESTATIDRILPCGSHDFCVSVTCADGTVASASTTVVVSDNIPPTITCPQDMTVTALAPNCDVAVNGIHHHGATDNCGTPTVAYAITGATTASGPGNASGNVFSSGTSTVTYTATDWCNNTVSCSFDVTIECDTCSCLGFSGLEFDNSPGLPNIQVTCNATSVDLPCIVSDALYWFQWQLNCSDPMCMQSTSYVIVPAAGGPPVLSGSVPLGSPPFLNFTYNQLGGAGNYQLILTGSCGTDSCTCAINFTVPECCNCGGFSDMTWRPTQGGFTQSAACGDTLAVLCDQTFFPQVAGMFQCVGTQCPSNQTIQWVLQDPAENPIQSGPLTFQTNFLLALDPAWFVQPGIYTLTFNGSCGGQMCPPCVFYLESEGCLLPPENCCFEWVGETIGNYSVGNDIISDAAGNIYTTGLFYGTVDFDPGPGVFNLTSNGPPNTFVLKLDAGGNFVWALSFGPEKGVGYSIAIDVSGYIYIVGLFSNTCDFDPGPAINNLTANNQDAFLLKLDAAGQFIWVKQIRAMTSSTGNSNQIFSLAFDIFGNIYATGIFVGTTDFDPGPGVFSLTTVLSQCFVIKLDNDGNFVWVKQLEGISAGLSSGWSISVDLAGNVYTTGTFYYTVDFDPSSSVFSMTATGFREIFILKLDPAGNFIWARQIEGTPGFHNSSSSIKIDHTGDVIVSGTFEFSTDFDPGPSSFYLTASGGRDGFVLKLDNNGGFVWAKQIGAGAPGGIGLARGLAVDATGDIFLSGYFYGVNDFDPGSNVYYYSPVGNNANTFILKLDQSGDFVWAKFLEGAGYSNANNIVISPFADIYTTGVYNGTIDFNPGTAVLNFNSNTTNQFVHKLSACPSNSCLSPDFSFTRLEPCKYRFQVEAISACYPQLRLQLDTNMFVSWSVDSENGWIAEEISSTEILLTHNSGTIPVGLSMPIEFDLNSGENPVLSINWDNTCQTQENCSTAFLLESCPGECYCGTFSDLFFRGPQGALSQPVTCGGPSLNIGCPTPGIGYTLTGSFLCEGGNCLTEADVNWDLVGPNGASVVTGMTQAAPWFVLQFSSAYFVQAGVYTLIMTGHCGSQTCFCIIELQVEEGCPNPCPCDLEDLQADVQQGFATSVSGSSCRACFTPLSLSDCDEAHWFIDDPLGTPVGSSTGNQTFCHTFPGVGSYTVYMTVIRKRSDGTLCESSVKAQTLSLTCLKRPDCEESVYINPGFSEGAIAGGLNSGGMSMGWQAAVGEPILISDAVDSYDGWSMELTGSLDDVNVLTSIDPVCLAQDTGTLSIRYILRHWGDPHENLNGKHIKDWQGKVRLYQGDFPGIGDCGTSSCFDLASFELTAPDTGWVDVDIPYDLNNWMALEFCDDPVLIPMRLAIYVTSVYSNEQGGGLTKARIEMDKICSKDRLVAVHNPATGYTIQLFPNPTTGELTLHFENVFYKERQLEVIDLLGRKLNREHLNSGIHEHTISLANFPAGIYFVRIWEAGIPIWVEKVVKQ